MGAVPGHSTAPLGKLTVDAADFMFLTGCSNQFIPVESSLLLIQFSLKAPSSAGAKVRLHLAASRDRMNAGDLLNKAEQPRQAKAPVARAAA